MATPRVIPETELLTPTGQPFLATLQSTPDAHLLGVGNTGTVRAAQWRPAEAPGRSVPVAVKTALLGAAGGAGAAAEASYRREAAVQADLSHPHIAAVHGLGDFVVGGARALHCVMELGSGGGLDALVQAGGELHSGSTTFPLGSPARLARVAHLGAQAALGLLQAHARGYAHCDVKLANLILSPAGRVLVTDFGIAFRVRQGGRPLAPGGTLPGQRVQLGTFKYLPPENFEDCPDHTGQPPCDVYALAFALLELAQGELLPEPTLLGATQVLPPPGSVALAALGIPCNGTNKRPLLPEAVDPRLAALIQACWEADPRARPPMAEVARQLLDVHSQAAGQELAAGLASTAALRAELEAARSAAALAVEAAARRAAADEAAAAAQLAAALQAQAAHSAAQQAQAVHSAEQQAAALDAQLQAARAQRVAAEEAQAQGAREAQAALQAELQEVRGAAAAAAAAAASGAATEREAIAASLQQAEAAAADLQTQLAAAIAAREDMARRLAQAQLELEQGCQQDLRAPGQPGVQGAAANVGGGGSSSGAAASSASSASAGGREEAEALRGAIALSLEPGVVPEAAGRAAAAAAALPHALAPASTSSGGGDEGVRRAKELSMQEFGLGGAGRAAAGAAPGAAGGGQEERVSIEERMVSIALEQSLGVVRVRAEGQQAAMAGGGGGGLEGAAREPSAPLAAHAAAGGKELHIVSGSGDFSLKVWKVATGKCMQELHGHTMAVKCVCVLGDGRLVSGSKDGTLRVWDAAAGVCVRVLEGHAGSVASVCSLQGGHIVSGSEDCRLRVWDADTGECVRVLEGHIGTVNSVCALDDGRIVSGSSDFTLRVWEASTGALVRKLTGHFGAVWSVCALGGGLVASGSSDSYVRVWDAAKGGLKMMRGHSGSVLCVCALGDGRLMSGSMDNSLKVWDAATGVCVRSLQGHSGPVNSVCALGEGRVVSGSDDKTVRVWSDDKKVRVWDEATEECRQVLEGHTGSVISVCLI